MSAKGVDFYGVGGFSFENGRKSWDMVNESTDFVRAGGCNGRFWAMIMDPLGAGLRRSAGGARVRGGRAPQVHHGSLNRMPPQRD